MGLQRCAAWLRLGFRSDSRPMRTRPVQMTATSLYERPASRCCAPRDSPLSAWKPRSTPAGGPKKEWPLRATAEAACMVTWRMGSNFRLGSAQLQQAECTAHLRGEAGRWPAQIQIKPNWTPTPAVHKLASLAAAKGSVNTLDPCSAWQRADSEYVEFGKATRNTPT